MVLVVRPGYRIGSRTIKRGSRVSNLIVSFGESSNLHTCHHLSWFFFGFYPCEVLELVVIFMTSSSSSKTDFAWNSYRVFVVWRFYRFIFIAKSNLLSFGFILLCWTMMFYGWSCRARCGDSNEPKIIENGVRMQKLWQFSYWCFLLGRIIRAGRGADFLNNLALEFLLKTFGRVSL
jgi:hypothetical protein